jgi:hypothetical protein
MSYLTFNILAELRKFQRGAKMKTTTESLLLAIADDYIARHSAPKKK